jgi:hypothetical protein
MDFKEAVSGGTEEYNETPQSVKDNPAEISKIPVIAFNHCQNISCDISDVTSYINCWGYVNRIRYDR